MSNAIFVLIPGAGGDPWYWHLVVPRLMAHGCEAIAVSIPAADDSAGLPEYADAVVRAIGEHDPARIILVAQSLGGFVAPLVCARAPVRMMVFVNAMIPKAGESPGEWFAHSGQREARREQARREARAVDGAFDPLTEFFHDVPQPVIDAAWARGDPKQSDAVFASRCALDHWPTTPVRVLASQQDRFAPVAFQKRIARERLGVEADEMPGGHLVALSQPDVLVSHLLRYIST